MLGIATQAILVHRATLEVASHNIANVNTPGYSRQKAFLENNGPNDDFFGKIGTGVFLRSVKREADIFLNTEIYSNTSGLGKLRAQSQQLQRLEAIFNESVDAGVSKAIKDFFSAWNDLANKPEGIAERNAVLERGKVLRDTIRRTRQQIDDLNRLLSSRLSQVVAQVNTYAQEIRSLNVRVANTEGQGSSANDERDLREQRMKELSELVSFQSYEDPVTKMVNITVGGLPLVAGNVSNSLSSSLNTSGNLILNFVRRDGSTQAITNLITGGQAKGLIDLRNTTIPDYQSRLDTLAREIIEEVNRVHTRGVGLATDSTGKSAGFTSITSKLAIKQSLALGTAVTTAGSPFSLVDGGTFTIHAYDSTGQVIAQRTFTIDSNNSSASLNSGTAVHSFPAGTLVELAMNINTTMGANLTATVTTVGSGTALLTLGTDAGTSYFTFSEDSSDLLSVLGMNTFFSGDDSRDFDIDSVVLNDVNHINASKVDRRDFMSNAVAYGSGGPLGGSGFSLGFGSAFTPGTMTIDVYDQFGSVIETKSISIRGQTQLVSLDAGTTGYGIDATFENLEASVNGGGTLIGIRAIGMGKSFVIRNDTSSFMQNLQITGNVPGPRNFSQGDNRNALELSALESALVLNGNTQTFSEYYSDFQAKVGSEVQNNQRNFDQQELSVEQLEGFRDERAGVNLDEEIAKLIKYEQAYNASARLVALVQQLTDTLLNIIGA